MATSMAEKHTTIVSQSSYQALRQTVVPESDWCSVRDCRCLIARIVEAGHDAILANTRQVFGHIFVQSYQAIFDALQSRDCCQQFCH